MRLDRAGLPFIGGALIAALAAWALGGWPVAAIGVALAAFFTFFFRDPDRSTTAQQSEVLSPADGRVLVAGPALADSAPPGSWQQVSIFLSPLDVHVNRIPASGRITRVAHTPGRFLPAYHDHAAGANERTEIWIDHDGQIVVARQVVGVLARRVVCRVHEGAEVSAGERYGIMKFGSRMDVYLPVSATVRVAVGDRVRGGQTVIAVLHSGTGAA